jgi:hypothetical protein
VHTLFKKKQNYLILIKKENFMKTTLIFLMVLSILSACNESGVEKKSNAIIGNQKIQTKNENDPSGKSDSPSDALILTFNFSRKVTLSEINFLSDFVNNANLYKLEVNVQDGKVIENATVKCFDISDQSIDPKKLSEKSFIDNRGTQLILDLSSFKNFEIRVSCGVYVNDRLAANSVEQVLYKDLVIDRDVKFNDLGLNNNGSNKIGALIIKPTGILTTDGQNISINATDFVMENGAQIQTFRSSDLTAEDGKAGRSGGMISIVTDHSAGNLFVKLLGQSGGRQLKEQLEVPAILNYIPQNINIGHQSCPRASVGPRGIKGFKGFRGLEGGDTGTFFMEVMKNSKMETDEKSFITKIGKGSSGGLGGKGGLGGMGDRIFITHDSPGCSMLVGTIDAICMTVVNECNNVSRGSNGENGDNGDVGSDGKVSHSQIKILNEVIYEN